MWYTLENLILSTLFNSFHGRKLKPSKTNFASLANLTNTESDSVFVKFWYCVNAKNLNIKFPTNHNLSEKIIGSDRKKK
jgi:hypothetical protein